MATTRIEWNHDAVQVIVNPHSNPALANILTRLAARVVVSMKAKAPASKVQNVYARQGRTVPGGRRLAGDFPLRPSGYLRRSIQSFTQPDGSIIVGPTASYSRFVNDGTLPHEIRSHGPWPLRNRATGQIFGPVVHHPGTRGSHFVERSVTEMPPERFSI